MSTVAYRPLVELVALFAFAIRCRGLHTADINVFIGRTINFSELRVRFPATTSPLKDDLLDLIMGSL